MDMRDWLILARDVDDEMDNQDDEDREGFLRRNIKIPLRERERNRSYYNRISEHFFDRFD